MSIQTSDALKLRDILDLARREITSGNAPTGLRLLRDVKSMAAEHKGTSLWGEYKLEIAEGFAGKSVKGDDSVVGLFQEAIECIKNLPERDVRLEVRAHESFGCYLYGCLKSHSKALKQFEAGLQLAVSAGLEQRSDELRLKIIRTNLEIDSSPQLRDFITMRHVGNEGGYTARDELKAWCVYSAEAELSRAGRLYARESHGPQGQVFTNKASEGYFRNLLQIAAEHSGDGAEAETQEQVHK